MTSSAVVNRYANALVDVVTSPSSAAASGPVDSSQIAAQLRRFEAALKTTPELGTVLASPAVSAPRKRAVIRRIGESLQLDRVALNFLLVLSDHRRAASLSEVIDAFEVLLDERRGLTHAEIRSAAELAPREREQLAAQLNALAGGEVRLKFTVDPDLIGGATARVGSKVYDGSVRGQLAALRQRLSV